MEIEKEVNLLYLKSYYKNKLKWFDLICRSKCDGVENLRNPKRSMGASIHY